MLTSVLVIITSMALLVILTTLFIRCQQGDQRAINTTSQFLLPLLSVVVITANLLKPTRQLSPTCSLAVITIFYTGIIIAILLILISIVVFFFFHRNHNRLIITQPVLIAAIIVTLMFLIEFINGCL